MRSDTKTYLAKAQQGIAMIEVLISVLLLAIGILGLVGFQASMSKNTTQAKLRSEAAFLANQLIGQMWADRDNLVRYVVVAGDCQQEDYVACASWANAVRATLPSSAADVSLNGNTVSIALEWTLPGEQESRYDIDAHIIN